MQRGLGRLVAGARRIGIHRHSGRLCAVVLLSLAAAACANLGQLSNLSEGPNVSVAFESIDGAPPAVFNKFMGALKQEAATRQVAVVAPAEADYRLHGYLAVQGEGSASTVAWAWDVYDRQQRRTLRINGQEKGAPSTGWASADDDVLRKIARAGVDKLALLNAAPKSAPAAAAAETPPPAPKRNAMLGWIDDWTPEAAGIFRVFKREPKVEIVDAGIELPPPGEVPLPVARPSPGPASERALAFSPND